jgi:hypothetical protein
MTRDDLVNEALTRLGALPAGQAPEDEDFDYVNDRVPVVLDDLAERGVVAVSPSDIPDAAFLHIAAVLAYQCRGYFGVVGQEAAELLAGSELAERKLRYFSRGVAQDKPVRAEYF